MAFEATHIRFALGIKSKYKIKNLDHYVSGSIYPDSRYITKINRELTHNDNVLLSNFGNTDFKCGWQSHVICDLIQEEISREILPEIYFENNKRFDPGMAAIKLVQDMSDMKSFPLNDYLKCLDYVENPNGENINKIIEYNQLIKNTYLNKSDCTIDDYEKIIKAFYLGSDLIRETLSKAQEILHDNKKLEKVKSIYNLMLNFYNKNNK